MATPPDPTGEGDAFLGGLVKATMKYGSELRRAPVVRMRLADGEQILVYGASHGLLPDMVALTVYSPSDERDLVEVDGLKRPSQVVIVSVRDIKKVELLYEAPPPPRRRWWPHGLSAHAGVPGVAGFRFDPARRD